MIAKRVAVNVLSPRMFSRDSQAFTESVFHTGYAFDFPKHQAIVVAGPRVQSPVFSNRGGVRIRCRTQVPISHKTGVKTVNDAAVVLVLSTMFGLGSILMAALAVAAFRKTRRWRAEGVTVEGEVVGIVERELSRRDHFDERDDRVQKYSPLLSYIAADGNRYQVTASACEPHGAYTLGQRLPVRYLASMPNEGDLETMAVSNVPGIALSILAFLAGAAAVLVFTAAQGG